MLEKFNSFIEKWMACDTGVSPYGSTLSGYCEAWCSVCNVCVCVYDFYRSVEIQVSGCCGCV